MSHFKPFKVAAIQSAPHYLDVGATLDKACLLIEQAAETGAAVAAFPEAWLPGYPFFAASGASTDWWRAAARYLEASIEVPGPETERLCATARRCGIDIVIGVIEKDTATYGSVYCTILTIGREGKIIGRHRKTRPTHVERAIWADGDASGLVVHPREYGRLSSLNCWEHNAVLPGYALMTQGPQIHFALWPGREWNPAPPAPTALSRVSFCCHGHLHHKQAVTWCVLAACAAKTTFQKNSSICTHSIPRATVTSSTHEER